LSGCCIKTHDVRVLCGAANIAHLNITFEDHDATGFGFNHHILSLRRRSKN
jgi:hypothetical protein